MVWYLHEEMDYLWTMKLHKAPQARASDVVRHRVRCHKHARKSKMLVRQCQELMRRMMSP